jgi:hypothetical protein
MKKAMALVALVVLAMSCSKNMDGKLQARDFNSTFNEQITIPIQKVPIGKLTEYLVRDNQVNSFKAELTAHILHIREYLNTYRPTDEEFFITYANPVSPFTQEIKHLADLTTRIREQYTLQGYTDEEIFLVVQSSFEQLDNNGRASLTTDLPLDPPVVNNNLALNCNRDRSHKVSLCDKAMVRRSAQGYLAFGTGAFFSPAGAVAGAVGLGIIIGVGLWEHSDCVDEATYQWKKCMSTVRETGWIPEPQDWWGEFRSGSPLWREWKELSKIHFRAQVEELSKTINLVNP